MSYTDKLVESIQKLENIQPVATLMSKLPLTILVASYCQVSSGESLVPPAPKS